MVEEDDDDDDDICGAAAVWAKVVSVFVSLARKIFQSVSLDEAVAVSATKAAEFDARWKAAAATTMTTRSVRLPAPR